MNTKDLSTADLYAYYKFIFEDYIPDIKQQKSANYSDDPLTQEQIDEVILKSRNLANKMALEITERVEAVVRPKMG